MTTEAQRDRYERAYYRLFAALTILDEMCHDYPEPALVADPALAFELEDLAARIEALTALHVGVL